MITSLWYWPLFAGFLSISGTFQTVIACFKCLRGILATYFCETLNPCTAFRALRSTNQLLLDVSTSRLKNRDDRAVLVAAPRL